MSKEKELDSIINSLIATPGAAPLAMSLMNMRANKLEEEVKEILTLTRELVELETGMPIRSEKPKPASKPKQGRIIPFKRPSGSSG